MKKMAGWVFTLCLALTLIAGGMPAKAAVQPYRVGIVQLTPHQALDAATEGFCAQLNARCAAAGCAVTVDVENAWGDPAVCADIARQFAAEQMDLILAVSTPALQAAQRETAEIPILGVAVTDYTAALGVEHGLGGNVSGTTDRVPPEAYPTLLGELMADGGRVGLLYSAENAAETEQMRLIGQALDAAGMDYAAYPFTDSQSLLDAARKACTACSALSIPADDTAARCAEQLREIVVPAGVPLISEGADIAEVCGVAALTVDYRDLGAVTGDMAFEILALGTDPGSMEIRSASAVERVYNPVNCGKLGIQIPQSIERFRDIPANAYYREAVAWAVNQGVTGGVSDTEFAPDRACTRAQMVTFLWRAMGAPQPASGESAFLDVAPEAYYAQAVQWAAEQGITGGTGPSEFSPDGIVTRGQTAVFLWRASGKPAASGPLPFTDVDAGAYYGDAVAWAVQTGITGGKTASSFAPGDACTRAQIVTFLYRTLGSL